MSLRKLVRQFTPALRRGGSAASAATRTARARRRGLSLESLEARQMLTINYSITGVGADLTITGDASANNITVDFDGFNYTLTAVAGGPFVRTSDPGNLVTGHNTNTIQFSHSDVDDLFINLLGGNDTLTFNTDGPNGYAEAMRLEGDTGNDTLNVMGLGGTIFRSQLELVGWDTINFDLVVQIARGTNLLNDPPFATPAALSIARNVTTPVDAEITINGGPRLELLVGNGHLAMPDVAVTNIFLDGSTTNHSVLVGGNVDGVDVALTLPTTVTAPGAIGGLDLGSTGSLSLFGEISVAGELDIGFDTDNDETLAFQLDHAISGSSVRIASGGTAGPIDTVVIGAPITTTTPGSRVLIDGPLLRFGSEYNASISGPMTGTGYTQFATRSGTDLTGTTLDVSLLNGFVPTPGDTFTIVDSQTFLSPTTGTFTGLPEGATFAVGDVTFRITYGATTTNDVVLTATAPPPDMTFAISGTTLTVTDTMARNNLLAISFDGTNLVFDDPNAILGTATGGSAAGTVSNGLHRLTLPLASGAGGANLTQIVVNTAGGNDTLTIDQGATAAGRLPFNVTYNGGAGGDDGLAFQGGGTFNTATYNYTGPHSGDVRMDPDGPGGAAERIFAYSEIEPLANSGTATNVMFNLPATNDNVQLSDLGGGTFRLESTNATFEVTDFAAPGAGGTLVINMGGGNDDIAVMAVPTGVTTTINGDAGNDTFRPQAASLAFSANGGTDNDTLVLATTATITGSFDGEAGTGDAIDFGTISGARNISLTALGATDGFNGTEASIAGGFSNVNSITGSAATDSLTNALVPAATATWEIDGTNRFMSGGRDLAFSAIENLNGGSLADTFTVTAAHTGNLTGNGGNDIFNVAGVTVTGNLAGNADNDTFNFSGAADVTGTIDGGAGGLDTMTLAGTATTVTHRFDNANDGQVDIDGRTLDYLGLDPIADNLSAVDRIFTFAGVTGDDITLGDDPTPLNGVSRISSVSSSETVDFVNPTGSLTVNAGVGADTVVVNAMDSFGGMPTVTINGGAGDDDITVNALPTALGNVVNGDADNDEIRLGSPGLGLAANGGAGTDTLFGANSATDWTITAANAGSVAPATLPPTATFATIENLVGGTAADSFVLVAPGTLTGSIDGGGGTDTLTGANVANTWTVTALNAGTVTGVGGGFSNVENLVGGTSTDSFTVVAPGTLTGSINGSAGTDTLTGANVANAWTVTALNAGTVTGVGAGFSNIENLVGGTSTDAFTLIAPGTLTGSINGGAGTDTLTAANVANTWTINAANAGAVTGVGASFSNVENLVGGTSTDDFNFTAAGTLSGSLDGGAGTDEIDYTTYGSARNVALTALGATDGFDGTEASIAGGFRNINTLRGTTGFVDSLTGLNAASTWNIAPLKTYVSTNTLTFADFETLNGGSATDVFNVAGANIESGEPNMLNGNGDTDAFNITLPANGGLVAAAGTTLAINGGAQAAGGRDTVNIDATADSIARVLEFRYQSAASGDVDILGIGTAAAVDVNTVEEVNYAGDAGNDDSALVRGTAGDDDLTVRPLSASAADVFLGGVFTNSVPTGAPGVDGGSTGPDISLAGILATGLSVNGNGGSDSLTVETPAAPQEINVTNVVVAPSMLVATNYTLIGETLNVVTGAGDDMVTIDLPDVAGGAGAITPGVDPNGPLPDFVRVLSDGGFDVVKYSDAGADQDHNVINFADLDSAALSPAVPTETAFQLAATECSVVVAGLGNDIVRNVTLFNNAGFSTNSVMDLGDDNDTAFGSNNGKKSFGIGEPPHGDVIYGGAGIDTLTAGTMGVKFLFADLDAMGVDHPMAGDVIDGSFNTQVFVSAGAGDFINNLVGGFFGTGSILNVVTWLKAQWLMGTGFADAQASKCANWGADYSGTNLGSLATQTLTNLNSLAADQWFDFTAAASGVLTATASFAPGDYVEVQIYDGMHSPLAWNLSGNGTTTAQTPVVAGGHYFIRVRGATTDVDLNLTIADPDAIAPTVASVKLGNSASGDWFTPQVGSVAQMATVPYAVDQVRITFSEHVQVSTGDLTVSGVNAASYGLLPGSAGFHYDAATHTATWTLATPIANDKIALTLADSIADATGNSLDGEWSNPLTQGATSASTFPSGNSVAGGSFEMRLDVLAGDVDGNGVVNLIDVALVRDAMTLGNDRADANRDGVVTVADLKFVADQMFRYSTLPACEPATSAPSPAAPQAPAAIVMPAAAKQEQVPQARPLRRAASTSGTAATTATSARRRVSHPAVDTVIASALAQGSETIGELRASRALRRLGRP